MVKNYEDYLNFSRRFPQEVAVVSSTYPKDFLLLQGVEQSVFLRIFLAAKLHKKYEISK